VINFLFQILCVVAASAATRENMRFDEGKSISAKTFLRSEADSLIFSIVSSGNVLCVQTLRHPRYEKRLGKLCSDHATIDVRRNVFAGTKWNVNDRYSPV